MKTPEAIPGIWSYGHRNPQGLAMDPRDGALYDTEHGPRGGDELNLVQPGKWRNDLFAGGLAAQEVRRLRLKDKKVISQEIVLKGIGRVRDVAAGPDGFIYVLLNGPDRIVRLIPAN